MPLNPKGFSTYILFGGIGAIAFQWLVQAFEVHHLIGSFILSNNMQISDPLVIQKLESIYAVPVVGASGAIFGVMVAFGMLYPDMEMMMFFIPVPIKAKYFVMFYVAVQIYSAVSPVAG